MPNFQMINGPFYSFCHDCGAKIKGEEKLKSGNAGNQGRKDVYFDCHRCDKHWWKDKTRLLVSIREGYYNGFGDWIRADENGNPLSQDVKKARQKRMKEKEEKNENQCVRNRKSR